MATQSEGRPILEMTDISKSFFGVKVLDDVALDLYPGEVLALVGENGAGKSTLIKILNGDYHKDGGEIAIEGEQVVIDRPRDAEQLGIRMIYQELHHCHDLSVMENLLLGHLPRKTGAVGKYVIDWKQARRTAEQQLGMLDLTIDPMALMGDLTVVEREIVEIVKAVSSNARIIVMDEPTAAMTPHEVEMLFEIVNTLRRQGVGIIYISHRLDEIFQIAQRVTVLRDGQKVGTEVVKQVTKGDIVRMVVGHEVEERQAEDLRAHEHGRDVVLEVASLTRTGSYEDISLQVHAGEIVGIFGLLGAGHSALTRTLFGAERADSGEVRVSGKSVREHSLPRSRREGQRFPNLRAFRTHFVLKLGNYIQLRATLLPGLTKIVKLGVRSPITFHSPTDARKAGVGLVPIDRKQQGLVLTQNVRENLTLSNWGAVSQLGFFQRKEERAHAQNWIDNLGIRVAGGMEVETRYMSGGNQQKVVLGRWLEANVKVLLMNEPTWGVDVGARSDIYDQLEALADQGLGILMVSSDMEEVLSVSHRIITMFQGKITGEFTVSEASQELLLNAAAGGEV
ncbi:MAG: sugar ABC transporter ATP-binding protein [Chloroflexi bacterium]|nr:sugar ABC transporter ATP-binding protein [Chloroflexota bacterium]